MTGRNILINGAEPPEEMVRDPARKPIALITQNTRVIATSLSLISLLYMFAPAITMMIN